MRTCLFSRILRGAPCFAGDFPGRGPVPAGPGHLVFPLHVRPPPQSLAGFEPVRDFSFGPAHSPHTKLDRGRELAARPSWRRGSSGKAPCGPPRRGVAGCVGHSVFSMAGSACHGRCRLTGMSGQVKPQFRPYRVWSSRAQMAFTVIREGPRFSLSASATASHALSSARACVSVAFNPAYAAIHRTEPACLGNVGHLGGFVRTLTLPAPHRLSMRNSGETFYS